MRKLMILGLSFLVLAATVNAELTNSKVYRGREALIGGSNESLISAPAVSPERNPAHSSLDLVGVNYSAGTTWYDYQHNGTAGKMIGTDDLGFVHVVWMNGLDAASANRHIYYNVWDPGSTSFLFPGGQQVDNSTRGGYSVQFTTHDGFCFPSYHGNVNQPPTDKFLTNVAIDFLPASGAFTSFAPNRADNTEIIWPKIAYGADNVIHAISTENPDPTTDPQRIYYSRGNAVFDENGFGLEITWDTFNDGTQMQLWDQVQVIAANVCASSVSQRVAIAYLRSPDASQWNNNLILRVSEDNGLNWGPETDLTPWIQPDVACASGDTLICNGDTLRPYTDLSMIFDNDDVLHIAFTTRSYFEVGYPGQGAGPFTWFNQSGIWHWGEDYQEFSPVASDYFFMTADDGAGIIQDAAWQLNVQRPNLCLDPVTGLLYCSFQRHDSAQYSENLFVMADAFVTVSCNNGRTWAEGTNVTETIGGENVPAGQSMHERDITLSPTVTYQDNVGYLHMEYVFDLDAGGVPQTEGVATLNDVYYQRIPVNDIPLTPYVDPFAHVLHVDSTGMPGRIIPLDLEAPCVIDNVDDSHGTVPMNFTLHQNYPNPFNPSTKIQYDLNAPGRVTLTVFNVIGQEVARLIDGEAMTAGVHVAEFDAAGLSSGVYMYRLNVDGVTATHKMVLMK